MLNPENVGFRVLTKSMDYILKAVKRKKKVIPIPVIYVYYSQSMPQQQCCSIMSMHTFKCERLYLIRPQNTIQIYTDSQ